MRLSICIPIYNCAEFIGAALDSMLPQLQDDMEIIVYDGGSTDDTEAVLATYVAQWPQVRYHRGATRGGIDADLVTCVLFAHGDYCWLFSGDDVMRPGAIDRVLDWMGQEHDLYVCKHTLCDRAMRVRREYPVLDPDVPLTIDFGDSAPRLDWFERAMSSEAMFSFLSGLIVRRDKWLAGTLPPAFNGSCWGHVARLLGLMSQGLRVTYVAETWLDQRGGNDSFRGSGIVKRYALAIDGFDRLSRAFFPLGSPESFHVRRMLRNEFSLRMFLDAKLLCAEQPVREGRATLDRLVRWTYGDPSPRLKLMKGIYRMTPMWALRIARSAVRLRRRRASQP